MAISSRTPEGSPNRCPVCGTVVQIEPSRPFGDAPCPECGTLLWFVNGGDEIRLFDSTDERFVTWLAERLNVSPERIRAGRWEELKLDSLDIVELVMEFESEFG